MDAKIGEIYGNRVRVRICGLCWQHDRLLLVNHKGVATGDFWAPPGGGLEFGEAAETALKREFLEETGLQVAMGRFLFACEYIQEPLHAIELFFEAIQEGGALQPGQDPEWPVIRDVRFLSPGEISALPRSQRHGIFTIASAPADLRTLTGFFRI